MTDQRSSADDFEAIAASLPATPEGFAELRALLTSRLQMTPPELQSARAPLLDPAAGAGGPQGGLTLVSQQAVGSETGGIVGVSPQLFFGQTNLLADPTFELMRPTVVVTGVGYASLGSPWQIRHVLNSGTLPTTHQALRLYERLDLGLIDNPFNSAGAFVTVSGFGANACNLDIYIQDSENVRFSLAPLLPYLLGSVRIQSISDMGDAAVTVYMEICNAADTLIVSSVPIDFNSLGLVDDVRQVVAVLANPDFSTDYRWRFRININKPAANTGAVVQVTFGEPSMQQFWTAEPPPYTPQTGRWDPRSARLISVDHEFLAARTGADVDTRWKVLGDGDMHWGDGTNPVDVKLYRGGANELKTDSKFVVAGFFANGGTSFPASPVTNDQYFRTDLGLWFFYNGTRWLSTTLYKVPIGHWNIAGGPFIIAATTAAYHRGPCPNFAGGSDIWLEDWSIDAFVASGGTALGASHKWEGQFMVLQDGTAGTGDNKGGVASIASGASNALRRFVVAIDALMDNGTVHEMLQTSWTKTGTPGNLQTQEEISFRIVAT